MRAIITGSASGIGRAVALRFAADATARGEQARLVLADIAPDGLEQTRREATRLGADVRCIVADLADPTVPDQIVALAVEAFGGLDTLISNAGINPKAALADCPVEQYDRVQAINTRATWLLGRAARPYLAQSKGAIVVTTSVSGSAPTPLCGAYSVSKAAQIMLVHQMALEWGPEGIRSNCVSPGSVPTGMSPERYASEEGRALARSRNPLGALGTVEDIADAIAFLAGPQARFINGSNLIVDGGMQVTLMQRGAAGLSAR